MTPWWLRPSAEGATNEEKKQQQDESHSPSQPSEPTAAPSRQSASSEQAAPAVPSSPAPAYPVTSAPAPQGGPSRGGYPKDAPSGGDYPQGQGGPSRSGYAQHGYPADPAQRDRPIPADPADPADPLEMGADTAAAPASLYRLPHPAERQERRERLDQPDRQERREPAAQLDDEPYAAPAALASAAAEVAEAGEGDEGDEEGRGEVKRKRSRRGRGGRRKNGRGAAAGGPAGAAGAGGDPDEDDDEPAEEPAPVHGPQRVVRTVEAQAPPPRPARDRGESYVISSADLDPQNREIVISVPDRQRSLQDERKIALFCDLENVALGVRDSEIGKFDIDLVLERLLEKGKIIVKKAYADWERYSDYKRPFHEAAIELIDIPQKYYSGKNSADIKMVVDAMDLSYAKEHLDTFVILSGDSDFSPLVSKLKENNKYVIGIGVKNSSSNLLVDNCDEFIYYEDVWRDSQTGPKLDGLNKKTAEAFSLMVESIQALLRENKDVLWGSMIKQTMQRKKPSFNEGYYGYSTFSELLEDAERKNIIKLKKDQRSGTYIVTGFAKSGDAGPTRRSV